MIKIKILFTYTTLFFIYIINYANAALEVDYFLHLDTATQIEISNIAIPEKGMMIYNTTSNAINYYNGVNWITLKSNSIYDTNDQISGNREIDLNTSSLGFLNGNIGIGDVTPDATLDVAGSFRIDGSFQDKDGDTGTNSQFFTSTGLAIDWISTGLAPNIANDTISVLASTTTTIVLTGSNFVPTSTVMIPGFNGTINSISISSPVKIELNITTATAATFDIVVLNNSIANTHWTGNGIGLLEVNANEQ